MKTRKQNSENTTEKPKIKRVVKYPEFGKRLKQCRLKQCGKGQKKMSQLALYMKLYGEDKSPDKIKIDRISCWERGLYYPTIEDLIKLADCLHVSVDYLLGRSEGENVDTDRISELTGLSADTVDSLINENSLLHSPEYYAYEQTVFFNDLVPNEADCYSNETISERVSIINGLYHDKKLLKAINEYFEVSTLDTVFLDDRALTNKKGEYATPNDIRVGMQPLKQEDIKLAKLLEIKKCLDNYKGELPAFNMSFPIELEITETKLKEEIMPMIKNVAASQKELLKSAETYEDYERIEKQIHETDWGIPWLVNDDEGTDLQKSHLK